MLTSAKTGGDAGAGSVDDGRFGRGWARTCAGVGRSLSVMADLLATRCAAKLNLRDKSAVYE